MKDKNKFNPIILGACALIEKEGKFLFTRQSPKAHTDAGKWFFPGGRFRLGESLETTVEREVKEELVLKIKFKELAGFAELISCPYHVLIFLCRCKIVSGKMKPGDDVDKAEWTTIKNISKYDLRPINKVIIDGKLIKEFVNP